MRKSNWAIGLIGAIRFAVFAMAAVCVPAGFWAESAAAPKPPAQVATGAEQANEESQILKLLSEQADAWNRGDIDSFMTSYWKSDETLFVGAIGNRPRMAGGACPLSPCLPRPQSDGPPDVFEHGGASLVRGYAPSCSEITISTARTIIPKESSRWTCENSRKAGGSLWITRRHFRRRNLQNPSSGAGRIPPATALFQR